MNKDEEIKDGVKTFMAKNAIEWRNWLEKNHKTEKSVWLIIFKNGSSIPSIKYPEAVNEALCFGWIDSKPNKRDDLSYYQFFARRNPSSRWSGLNKRKVKELIAQGKMTDEGFKMIRIARETGTWSALDNVEKMIVPEDLQLQFDNNKEALTNWQHFPPSSKKIILEWILSAKRTTTRQKRITETVNLAAQNIRANHYRP